MLFSDFWIGIFFLRPWQITGQQAKWGYHFLFHSSTSTHSRKFSYLFATLHVRWLSYIFNGNACIYQTGTRSYYTTLANYCMTHWWFAVCFNFFTWWFDTRFLLQISCYGRPVDSNSHRLSSLHCKRTD